MKTTIVKKEVHCEVCGWEIPAGETVGVRYDYDWDNPDEDEQGSITVPFYRHADPEVCKKVREVLGLKAQTDAQHEEDVFHKAIY